MVDGSRCTSGCSVRSLLSDAITRWRSVTSACSRLPMSDCSASAVPMRTSTAGSSRRMSCDVLSSLQPALDLGNDVIAVSRQRASGLVDELGPVERRDQRLDEVVAGHRRCRPDGFSRDLLVLVADERREQIGERVGHERHQARGLRALARAVGSRRAHHRLEQRARRVRFLRRARARPGTPPSRRGSRSPRSRRAAESATADRRASRASDRGAPRSGRRGPDP